MKDFGEEKARSRNGGRLASCMGGVFLFLATLVVCNYLLDLFGPSLHPPAFAQKLKHIEESEVAYDVVFIGSSYVYRQLNPDVFDEEMAKQGYDLRSYNMGFPGLVFHEMDQLLDDLLAIDSNQLRWILVDAANMDVNRKRQNRLTSRAIWGATPGHTWSYCRGILASSDPWPQKLGILLNQTVSACARSLHIGTGQGLINQTMSSGEMGGALDSTEVLQRGFFSLDQSRDKNDLIQIRRRNAFLRAASKWPRRVERFRQQAPDSTELSKEYLRAAYSHQVQKIHNHGVAAIYVLSPCLHPHFRIEDLAKEGVIPKLFAYNLPEDFPELYAANMRSNFNHLTEEGADLYTRQVARDFSAYLKEIQ